MREETGEEKVERGMEEGGRGRKEVESGVGSEMKAEESDMQPHETEAVTSKDNETKYTTERIKDDSAKSSDCDEEDSRSATASLYESAKESDAYDGKLNCILTSWFGEVDAHVHVTAWL